jgi:hypothetical protein
MRQRDFIFRPDTNGEYDRNIVDVRYYCIPCFTARDRVWGLVLRPSDQKGEFRRVAGFEMYRDKDYGDLDMSHKNTIARGDIAEKALITEDLYELYDEETDHYVFRII